MNDKLKIVYRPLKELTPYARNARTHSGEQVAQLVASIEEFGWTNPVLIDENGEIIAGHGRVLAAEAIGIVSVPTIKLTGLTEEQKRAYRLADNKLPQNARWDDVLLKSELRDLASGEFDLSLIGFSEEELNALLGDVQEIDFNKDEDSGGIDINYLAFSRKKIPMTEEEVTGLLNALNDYVEENGSFFGFVSHLIGAETDA
ncbi:nuclease [Lelliottia nimipressuralis]|uniref:Nuclease n=1 Tax=Lelliottia nimipressuralis TaxID=69220 RepID=A0ABY3P6C9_9ENTR|nr:ParB/Srx family N-terminal domain-containing protein [Lelliottia nimipressuralis]RXJ10439.1 nuclease [Lelliottia nimipressuralis]TYT34992.1 nuclease [Lelliottia nimipressuralis]